MENLSDKKIKFLQSDHGAEYVSAAFAYYLNEAGIQFERAPYETPQHNSVAERFNRTLVERLRCALLAANLPLQIWEEISQEVVYILNCSPNSTIQGELPMQKWISTIPGSGLNSPNLSFLPVLGCQAVYLTPRSTASKLEAKGIKAVLVGYQEGAKAYRFWNNQTNKIIVCRNGVFNENVFPFQSSPSEKNIDYSILEDFSPPSIPVVSPSLLPDPSPHTSPIPCVVAATKQPLPLTRPKRSAKQPDRLGHLFAHHKSSLSSDKPTCKRAMMSPDAD